MQTRSSSSASADLVPSGHRREAQLKIVNRPSRNSKGNVDTFIKPVTGRQFPSLESVHKHFSGEEKDRRLIRAKPFFKEKTRVYEGSRTKQDHRILQYASKGFRLPKGWSVEEFPRANSHHIDKYYVERKTGKRFRSLVSAERYLKESGNHTDQQLIPLQYHRGHSKDFSLKESGNHTDQQLIPLQYHRGHSKDFSLPDGWIVQEKPRRNSKQIDRLYIEPGMGNKFRSMAAVERYLKAVGNGTYGSVSMVHSRRLSRLMNRNGTGFETEVIDPNPPEKVKWVFTGPGGNMFSAHVNGSDVSSSVKQTWSEAFVSLIQDRS